MNNWEVKIEKIKGVMVGTKETECKQCLEKNLNDGWQFIGFIDWAGYGTTSHCAFKREKSLQSQTVAEYEEMRNKAYGIK